MCNDRPLLIIPHVLRHAFNLPGKASSIRYGEQSGSLYFRYSLMLEFDPPQPGVSLYFGYLCAGEVIDIGGNKLSTALPASLPLAPSQRVMHGPEKVMVIQDITQGGHA